jgi:hypothetical protein
VSDRVGTAGEARSAVPDRPVGEPDGSTPHGGAQEPATGGPRAVLGDVVAVLGVSLLLGLGCGVLWWLLVDPAMFTKDGDGGSMGELELGRRFNADGWYAVLAGLAGLTSGVLLTWWRSRDLLLTTVLLVVGTAVAAAVMSATGHWLGPGDADAALARAKAGEQVPAELEVTARATYLVWPMAALVGALVVLWSPPRDSES